MNELLSTNIHYFLCLIGQYFGYCGHDVIAIVGKAMQTVQFIKLQNRCSITGYIAVFQGDGFAANLLLLWVYLS